MPLNISWQFAANDGGVDVVRDPSSSHFSGAPLSNAVREAVQNSLDARQEGLDTVEVSFKEVAIPRDVIDANGLQPHLEQCLLRADSEGRASIKNAYQTALQALEKDLVRCLKIQDTGTTGLRGVNWNALVLQEGAVEKQSSDTVPGGSYGIGKNAVLNISDAMTVFYSTRYVEGRRGRVQKVQGKTTLMSHPDPVRPMSNMLQHVGFCRKQNGEPITGVREIPEPFQLEETGTGIYVVGFNPHCDDWVTEIRAAVIANFFYAIHNRGLEVKIEQAEGNEVVIDNQTVALEFESCAPESAAQHYYHAISGQQAAVCRTVESRAPVGTLRVYLITGIGPRRTAYVNQNGMLISDSRDQRINPLSPMGRGLWPDYCAVIIPETKQGAAFLSRLENPAHNALSIKHLPEEREQKQADRAMQSARSEIRSLIDETVSARHGDGLSNVTELNHRFPELEYLFEQNLTTRVVPDGQVVVTLDNDADEAEPGPSHQGSIPAPPLVLNQPRVIPTGEQEAVLAFTPSNVMAESIHIVLKPAGEEPMNQRYVFVETAEIVSPPHAVVEVINGGLYLNRASEERVTVRVTTRTAINHLAVQMEAH